VVVVRLTRVGKKKQAHYRIVVADSRRAVQGKFLSILGWYNPHTKELQVKKEELKAWFDKGAQPSNTLAKLLRTHKIDLPKWVKITEKKKAPKKAAEAAPTSGGAGVPTDNVGKEPTDTPADEVKEEKAEATEETTEPEAAESDVAEAMPDKEEAVEEEAPKDGEKTEEAVEDPEEEK